MPERTGSESPGTTASPITGVYALDGPGPRCIFNGCSTPRHDHRGYRFDDIMNGVIRPGRAALMILPHLSAHPVLGAGPRPAALLHRHRAPQRLCRHARGHRVRRELHRASRGPEATPYLPNVIVSGNPLIRPEDYGISPAEHWDERTIRNVKMPWSRGEGVARTSFWEKGFNFYCLTPKSRHRVHSGGRSTRLAHGLRHQFRRPLPPRPALPSVGDHQLHMNPQAARDLGINDGDYV